VFEIFSLFPFNLRLRSNSQSQNSLPGSIVLRSKVKALKNRDAIVSHFLPNTSDVRIMSRQAGNIVNARRDAVVKGPKPKYLGLRINP
jgi:hypothetical protein